MAYMLRFDAKKGYYLYPEAGDVLDLQLRLNQGTTYENNVSPREDSIVIKHGLWIPNDVVDYDDFVEKMKVSENAFKEELLIG